MNDIPTDLLKLCLQLAYAHVQDTGELGEIAREIIQRLEAEGVVLDA